jgi:adenosine deaminase
MIRSTMAALAAWAVVLAAHPSGQRARPAPDAAAATARYFASIRNDPGLVLAFLGEMPKGGDLHIHLSGAIYAESYLRWAAADNLCVAAATLAIVGGTCDVSAGRPPASTVVANNALYDQAIDAMSMRNWNRALRGHDHFFAAFEKFGPAALRIGEMLAEVTARAAADRVSYLELMVTPDNGLSAQKGVAAGWDADFERLRDKLLASNFGDVVAAASRRLDEAERRRGEVLRCGTPAAEAGCAVTVRYVAQVLRAAAPESVFAQMLGAFEIASREPRVVGVNLVQPEDMHVAIRDFSLHMRMLGFLHHKYPGVPLTLHAGELVDGLVPPEALRFHVTESIRVAGATRIGHGTAVMHETDPFALLREMASKRVLVEIALTSNDFILGITGPRHPLRTYLKFGVPVALVTDDAGVSRSSMTLEYRKAVEEQGVDYPTLKIMARNSIDFSFADAATRTRLRGELEAAFRRFETTRSVR